MNDATPASVLTGEHLPAGALPKSEIVEYDKNAAGLAELRRSAALGNFDLTTTAGDKAARAVRAQHVELRTRVESLRVAAKQPHLDRGREIDAAAKFLTAEITRSEKPLDEAILAKQREREVEKARKEQAERERIAAIDKRLAWIAAQPAEAAKRRKADAIAAILATLRAAPITEALYVEKLPEATGAHLTAVAAIEQMLAVAAEQEAEAARLAAERARIDQERAAADAERAEADRKRREAQEAEDKVRREAQEREDAARREAQRVEDEQRAAARKAEEDRLAAARAEQERVDREARERRERDEKAAADERQRRRKAIEVRAEPWLAIESAHGSLLADDVARAIGYLEDAIVARDELAALDAAA